METIDIKHAHLLPFHFRVFGGAIILLGLLLPVQIQNFVALVAASAGCVLVGVLFITTRYGIQIDPAEKRYREYIKILGFNSGSWKLYDSIEKVFINPMKSSQTMTTRGNYRTEIVKDEYMAFLKFGNGTRVELDEDSNKEKLLARLTRYNQVLHTNISDNT